MSQKNTAFVAYNTNILYGHCWPNSKQRAGEQESIIKPVEPRQFSLFG